MDEDDNGNQGEQDLGDELEVSSSQAKKRKGRGPTKAIQTRKPMFLEFDEFELPTGEWEKNYGQQLGRCALKLDINVHE